MTWLQDQVSKAISPTLNTLDQAQARTDATASGAISNTGATASQTNQDIAASGSPYTSAGSTAMNAYMDALGLPYQTSAGTAAGNKYYTTSGGNINYTPEAMQQIATINSQTNNGLTMGNQPGTHSFTGTDAENVAKANSDWAAFLQSGQQASTGPTYSTPSSASDIMSRFTDSPGYQAALQQGLGTVNSKASASGLLGSGSQMKALERYGSDYAQKGYQSYLGNLLSSATLGQDLTKNQNNVAGQLGSSQIAANASLASSQINSDATLAAQKAKTQAGNFTIGNTAYVGF